MYATGVNLRSATVFLEKVPMPIVCVCVAGRITGLKKRFQACKLADRCWHDMNAHVYCLSQQTWGSCVPTMLSGRNDR